MVGLQPCQPVELGARLQSDAGLVGELSEVGSVALQWCVRFVAELLAGVLANGLQHREPHFTSFFRDLQQTLFDQRFHVPLDGGGGPIRRRAHGRDRVERSPTSKN